MLLTRSQIQSFSGFTSLGLDSIARTRLHLKPSIIEGSDPGFDEGEGEGVIHGSGSMRHVAPWYCSLEPRRHDLRQDQGPLWQAARSPVCLIDAGLRTTERFRQREWPRTRLHVHTPKKHTAQCSGCFILQMLLLHQREKFKTETFRFQLGTTF